MRPKRNLATILCEAATVLLITVAAFLWGVATARAERGCVTYGGEYLLLILIPPMYYIVKRMVMDWAADIWEKEKWK